MKTGVLNQSFASKKKPSGLLSSNKVKRTNTNTSVQKPANTTIKITFDDTQTNKLSSYIEQKIDTSQAQVPTNDAKVQKVSQQVKQSQINQNARKLNSKQQSKQLNSPSNQILSLKYQQIFQKLSKQKMNAKSDSSQLKKSTTISSNANNNQVNQPKQTIKPSSSQAQLGNKEKEVQKQENKDRPQIRTQQVQTVQKSIVIQKQPILNKGSYSNFLNSSAIGKINTSTNLKSKSTNKQIKLPQKQQASTPQNTSFNRLLNQFRKSVPGSALNSSSIVSAKNASKPKLDSGSIKIRSSMPGSPMNLNQIKNNNFIKGTTIQDKKLYKDLHKQKKTSNSQSQEFIFNKNNSQI